MLKKILIHTRRSIKIMILLAIAALLIIGIVAFFYKPTYSVTLDGEQVGYTENKSELQKQINDYIEKGDGENVAFVQVEELPEYHLCLLKRNIETNDDEIYNLVKDSGTTYYRYYALSESDQEKVYVSNFEVAKQVVDQLKEKSSSNIDTLSIVEKYETEKKDFVKTEDAVTNLYEEPTKEEPVATTASVDATKIKSTGAVNTACTTSSGTVNLGISLIRPITGTITSRFGEVSSIRSSVHTGLDVAAPTGTPVAAMASGVVDFAGYKGSYGNMLVINHGNGVQTYFGHCSKLYVSAGETVSQGDIVAAVGSTGNSTGSHLHIEIRVNGVAYNPQNYLY